jgi:ribosomal protein S18 acetylase RimI-like enzyme
MGVSSDEKPGTKRPVSAFVAQGGELRLSNPGQRELLRGLMERGVPLRTMVRGFSMQPFIRDQDVLTIAPLDGRPPDVGEIVAFTQPDTEKLMIHRVIRRTDSGWIMRGDNCPEADGIVGGESIIGRVTRIERLGVEVHLGLGAERASIAALNRGRGLMRVKQIWHMPRRAARFALRCMQAVPLYRFFGRRLAPPVLTLVADDNDLEAVHRRLNPFAPYQRQTPNPNVTNWVAKQGGKIIGFVQLIYHPEDHFPWVGYWLFSLHVWGLYRGLGIGEALTRRVIEKAETQGVEELFLAVLEDNNRAMRLYRKLGFAPISLPALEPSFAAEKQQSGRRRIVMRKRLFEKKT